VFRSNKPGITNFRADYAKPADFCDVFNSNTEVLYRLAFVLTANHKESEQCLVSTVAEAFREKAVFKEWAESWVKRRLIENAIEIISPTSSRNGGKRDLWSARQREMPRECGIDTVTKLSPFERFVFVMSVLERYSHWDCSLLLGCSMNKVAQARMGAVRRLPELAAFPRIDGEPLRRLKVTSEKAFPLTGSSIVYRC
jgi:DNA-directed RNA polymerase specialized sigma24 family protein